MGRVVGVALFLVLFSTSCIVANKVVELPEHLTKQDLESLNGDIYDKAAIGREHMGMSYFTPLVSELLSSGNMLRNLKATSVRSCRDNEEVFCNPEIDQTCRRCIHRDVPIANISNEYDFVHALAGFCREEMASTSTDAAAFFGGYGSLIECIRMMATYFTHNSAAYYFNQITYNTHFHPIIQIPDSPACPRNWMWDLETSEYSLHSQAGQDGVLYAILSHITIGSTYFIEIGFNTPDWAHGSNTYMLHDAHWDGLLIDAAQSNPAINLHRHFVTPENVLDIFEMHNVPLDPAYISLDIDSVDLWVARTILHSKYRPRVMSVEFNSHLPIGSTLTMPPGMSWDGYDLFYGASAGAMKIMANQAGYDVVHLVGTLDMFLVRRDLLGGLCPPPFASFSNRVSHFHTCVRNPARKGKWVDYRTWLATDGDIETSQRAALEQMLLMHMPTSGAAGSMACLGLL